MNTRRASRNALASAAQTAASAGLMFVFYRRILDVVGAEGLGVWSVVLASTGAVRIGDLGLTGSAVKYAAGRLAIGEREESARVIETTILTVAVAGAVLAVAAYGVIDAVLPAFVPDSELPVARRLLPFAVVSLWFAVLAGAVQSGLDGCGRLDLRNGAAFVGQLVYVGLGWMWVSTEGLVGLAVAQLVQGVFVGVLSWVLVRWVLPEAPFLPWRWDRSLFREMLSYGVQYQALSIVRLLYEPVTKALMGRYGGLEAAGYYEMATLAWTKLRSFVVAAQQALTPEIAMLAESDPEAVNPVYEKANGLNWYLSIPLFSGVIAVAPLASLVWIGRIEEAFVLFMAVIGVGWFLNALSSPAFFVLLGTGEIRGVVAAHVTIGVVNAVGGVLLGWAFGAPGVAVAWAIGLAVGALHLLVRLRTDRGVPLVVPPAMSPLVWTATLSLVVGGALYVAWPASFGGAVAAVSVVTGALAVPVWQHPYRQRFLSVLRGGIGRSTPERADDR